MFTKLESDQFEPCWYTRLGAAPDRGALTMKKAFTLIELLVVIAIIAILAAILFPVFAQAKQAAKKTTSLSNIKQLALAASMYANDNDDTVVWQDWIWEGSDAAAPSGAKALGFLDPSMPAMNWGRSIFPYVKSTSMYQSSAPKWTSTGWPGYEYVNNSGAGNSSYAFNGAVMGLSSTVTSSPAELITLTGISFTASMSYKQPVRENSWPYTSANGTVCDSMDDVQLGNTFGKNDVYGYMDGHAKSLARTAVTYRNYGISGVVNGTNGADVTLNNAPNTTTMTDPTISINKSGNGWQAGGVCDISGL